VIILQVRAARIPECKHPAGAGCFHTIEDF
jgi:hypothetical protein